MPSKLNSEFNYRYQVIGETPWEKIKTLKGFLEGRIRAAVCEEVSNLKYRAKLSELEMLKENNAKEHLILNLQADILEMGIINQQMKEGYELNRQEIEILQKLLAELYEIAEPTRIPGYTDEQMFEANAANEFTVSIGKEIHAEIIANGRPSAAKIRNAMSNPHTWAALKSIGLLPKEVPLLTGNANPLHIELREVKDETLPIIGQ